MRDNPVEIADHLENEHGLKAALSVVGDSKTEAIREGDNYRLSILREVKVILQNRADGSDGGNGG